MDANLHLDDWAGRSTEVVMDRPLGTVHPLHADLVMELNYGYVPGTLAPDGHPLDVYVLGIDEPIERCTATVIAIIRRRNDVEDKLVAVIDGGDLETWDIESIARATAFQERWFDTWIEIAGGSEPPLTAR